MRIRGRASVCPNTSLPKSYSAIATRPASLLSYLRHADISTVQHESPTQRVEIFASMSRSGRFTTTQSDP